MPFPSAISSGDKTNLRAGSYSATQYIALCPNTTVFKAQVNQATFNTTFAEVTYDSVTTGAYTDIQVGQTVLISHSDDRRAAFFTGRVRKTPTADTLYINATSAALQDDDYIWVIKDVRLQSKWIRATSGNFFKDYDVSPRELLPVVYDIQSVYVVVMSGGNGDVALAPNAISATSGSSISSWSWDLDGGSFQSGSASSRSITARYTTAGHYMPRVTVTDDGGRSNFFTPHVFVVPADYSSVIESGFEGAQIERNIRTGDSASLTGFDGVDDVLDNTFVVLFTVDDYNGTTGPIVSNIDMLGRIRTENARTVADPVFSTVSDVGFPVEGIVSQLARLASPRLGLRDSVSPDEWDEINVLTIWRAISYLVTEHSTFNNIHALNFGDTTDDYRMPFLGTQDSSMYDAVNDLADAINARIDVAPSGECDIRQSARYLSDSDRNSLTTVMDMTTEDMLAFTIQREHVETTGRNIAGGGVYNATADKVVSLRAIAPAAVQGEGQETTQLNGQVLTADSSLSAAKSELAQRVANDLAAKNPIDTLDVTLPDGYHWIVPARFQWYTFTIGTGDNNRGLSYGTSDRWLCSSVTITHDNRTGTRDVTAQFQIETQDTGAQVIAEIAPSLNDLALPSIPPINAYPDFPPLPGINWSDGKPSSGEEQPYDSTEGSVLLDPTSDGGGVEEQQTAEGSVVVAWNANNVWVCTDFVRTANPTWRNVTPTTDTIVDTKWNPHNAGLYVLSHDGTDSRVWYTSNGLQSTPSWSSGNTVIGVYERLRTTDTDGEVYMYSSSGGWTHTFDFETSSGSDPNTTYGDGGFSTTYSGSGTHTPGTGWEDGNHTAADGDDDTGAIIYRNLGSDYNFTDASITVDMSKCAGFIGNAFCVTVQIADNDGSSLGGGTGVSIISLSGNNVPDGNNQTFNGSGNTSNQYLILSARCCNNGFGGSSVIRKATVSGQGTDPFGSSAQATTAYSTDHGGTFAVSVNVGDAVAEGGVDTVKTGDTILAAADEQVYEATNGGSYSAEANGGTTGTYAKAIWAYGQGSTNYLLATAGGTLYKVEGSQSDITPNDGTNGTVATPDGVTVAIDDDDHIVGVFSFGGTYKLAWSTDGGSTWSFNTTPSSSAAHVRLKRSTPDQVYIADGSSVLYSEDSGSTVITKTGPGTSLDGVEVRG